MNNGIEKLFQQQLSPLTNCKMFCKYEQTRRKKKKKKKSFAATFSVYKLKQSLNSVCLPSGTAIVLVILVPGTVKKRPSWLPSASDLFPLVLAVKDNGEFVVVKPGDVALLCSSTGIVRLWFLFYALLFSYFARAFIYIYMYLISLF